MLRARDDRAGLPVLQRPRRDTDLLRRLLLRQQALVTLLFDALSEGDALDTQVHAAHYRRKQSACQAQKGAAMKPAATNSRTFRTFLLMSQFEAKEIGARIALARNEAGLTQEELTEMATFSKRALQMWEAGNVIPYRQMQEISRLLDRPVEWFLHGERSREDDSESPVEFRLAELAAAVGTMGRQVEEAARSVSGRLDSIEQRLQTMSASEPPKGAGRRATGSRK